MSQPKATGNVTFNGVAYHCSLCKAGYACDGIGLSNVTSVCSGGYWCAIGAPSNHPVCSDASCTPMYGICPLGHYCPLETSTPMLCATGTFMNHTGASVCSSCPAGYYCDSSYSTSTYRSCPQGYYCPQGTGANWLQCPVGTFGGRLNLQSSLDCSICTAGSYCGTATLIAPTASCSAGYYCPPGSQDSHGKTSTSSSHVCPPGSYCPTGSGLPLACVPGTFNNATGKTSITECTDCTRGSYCGTYNLTHPTGYCSAVYYCIGGSNVSNP